MGRRWLAGLPIGVALAISGVLLFDEDAGLRALLDLRMQVDRSAARVGDLKAQRDRLTREIRSLRHDAFAIEAAARTSLGMVRPDELVVRLEER